jgi:hypothetical protein
MSTRSNYDELVYGRPSRIEPHCPVCGAISRYCGGHEGDGSWPGHRASDRRMAALSLDARAEGKGWGRFSGDPVARWAPDGVRMILMEPFTFWENDLTEWTAPAGTILDGASIPRAFWPLIGTPFRGRYRYASVIHDYHCVAHARRWERVHTMFYYACRASGTTEAQAKILYYAVYWFGPRWGARESTATEPMGRLTDLPTTRLETIERFIVDENPDLNAIRRKSPSDLGISGRNRR